jgi:hypothetical protein
MSHEKPLCAYTLHAAQLVKVDGDQHIVSSKDAIAFLISVITSYAFKPCLTEVNAKAKKLVYTQVRS